MATATKAKTEREVEKEKQEIVEEVIPQKNRYSIKPYLPANYKNGGLENYGMIVGDGVEHEEELALIDYDGNKRYINGLNEFAPEVALIANPEEKAAKIREIRAIVARIERERNANILDVEDEHFWDKVKSCKPDNDAFWGKIKIKVGNEPVFLNPETSIIDLVKLRAIEARGFDSIAPSLDYARMAAKPPLFYLDKNYDAVLANTEIKKTKNRAIAVLQNIYDANPSKLFLIAKVLDHTGHTYKKHTPADVLYDTLDDYLNGRGGERSIKMAAKTFIETSELDNATLKIKALIKDASFYKFIAFKSDGFIWHLKSDSMMGRNIEECVEYLKNPLNEKIYDDINSKVEQHWIK